MYDFLENNLLIICPNSYKNEILKYLTEKKILRNIKFMTLQEYINKKKFDYDEKAIYYLIQKGMKVDNAITYLNNLLYIDIKEYQNEKLDYLVSLKKELDEKGLLIYDPLFSKTLSKYKIVLYGYGQLDHWQRSLFDEVKEIDYLVKNHKFNIYHINNIFDEVEFVFQQIALLLKDNVDINKICLMNVDNEYYPVLKEYASFYGIEVDVPNNNSIKGTVLAKEVYERILNNQSLEEIKSYLDKYSEDSVSGIIINLLNKYSNFNLSDVQELIDYDFSHTKIPNKKYKNVVKIKNVFDYISDDEYVFLVGFNNPFIPRLSEDISYITDNIKALVGLDRTEEVNYLSKTNTLNYLKSIDKLVISYKDMTPFNTYYPSILLDDMDYEEKVYQRDMTLSIDANRNLYTSYLDDYVKYGIKNSTIDLLYSNYGENNYLAYDNSFTGINKDNLKDYLNNELTLSYSSIDNFYKCAFRYYLNNILKVNLYEETFMTIIGNLFHEVLRHMNDDNFDLNYWYDKFLEDKTFTNKEKFFLDKLKKDLELIIEVIRKHQFITGFSKMLYEERIDIILKNSPYVHFKGYVDKIMYKEKDNSTLVSIIDYKTGNIDIKINNLKFGLSMQLPIYLYLVEKSKILPNMKFTGFYLQHILNIDIKKGKKSALEQKYDNLKLTGYSTDDLERLALFDSTYASSEMIKGIKLLKDGALAKSAHALSDSEIKEIIQLTEEKILFAMEEILNGKFSINPKILDGKNVSCEYCDFKDICYMEDKNKEYLVSEEVDYDANLDNGTEEGD